MSPWDQVNRDVWHQKFDAVVLAEYFKEVAEWAGVADRSLRIVGYLLGTAGIAGFLAFAAADVRWVSPVCGAAASLVSAALLFYAPGERGRRLEELGKAWWAHSIDLDVLFQSHVTVDEKRAQLERFSSTRKELGDRHGGAQWPWLLKRIEARVRQSLQDEIL